MRNSNFVILLSIFFSGFAFSNTTSIAEKLFEKLNEKRFICGLSNNGKISFPKYEFDLKNNLLSSFYLVEHKANITLVRCDSYDFSNYFECEINASYEEKNSEYLYKFIFQEKRGHRKIELKEYSVALITNVNVNHSGEQKFDDLYNKYTKGKYTKLEYANWYGPEQLKKEFNGCTL